MSDTPRTDEWIANRTPSGGPAPEKVDADFARELERENAQLRKLLRQVNARPIDTSRHLIVKNFKE